MNYGSYARLCTSMARLNADLSMDWVVAKVQPELWMLKSVDLGLVVYVGPDDMSGLKYDLQCAVTLDEVVERLLEYS